MTSMKTNNTVKQVLKLGCSALITYSRFCRCRRKRSELACCVKEAYDAGVIPYLCTQITRLASESVLSMELAVVAAYRMNCTAHSVSSRIAKERSETIDGTILQTLKRIEGKWDTNPTVLQQILTNYAILANNGGGLGDA